MQRLKFRFWAPIYTFVMDWRFNGCVPLEAKIGRGLQTSHGFSGVFISTGAIIGDDVRIYQNVTIGVNRGHPGKVLQSPIIGNGVLIGANASIIGRTVIGDGAKIGAGVTLVDATVEPNEVIINKSAYSLTQKRPVFPD